MDLIPREVVYHVLRIGLPYFAVACLTFAAGMAALLLWRLRSRDRLLLWVGLFSILYAVRLFVENELVRDAFHAPGMGYRRWQLAITYLINIPYVLFVLELIGRGWKRIIQIWLWLYVAFAALAIPTTLVVRHRLDWLDELNSALVVSGTLLLLAQILLTKKEENPLARALLWPVLTFSVFVLAENQGFQPYGFSVEPLGFLFLLGGLGWIAVRRSLTTERRLLDVEQELATARRIQRAILPEQPPDIEGLRIATRYQPMTAVAGDFYDFLVTGERIVTALVADVSGHGVPAALVASMLKVSFAAQRSNARDPAAILAGLNQMLRGSLGGQYVTAACAAIDLENSELVYAGAGHPPALLRNGGTNDVSELAENGLFLGPFPAASYTNLRVQLNPGDAILLYTDGMIEARGANAEEFGSERLRAFLVKEHRREPGEFLDALLARVTTGEQEDDLTAVLLQVV